MNNPSTTKTAMMTPRELDTKMLPALRERLRGPVLVPSDAGYDEARALWNGLFDPRPAAVARCTGTADVIAAINFVREHGVRFSVKSTGHSYAGNSVCDGGLVIDLSAMQAVSVDPQSKAARVQPGVTWGAFDHEAQAFGLATTGATVSTVGVAGFTLGGGNGFLARKHGLALDNLRAADVVTADGELIRASEDEHADLFWALRGGGGNFGVVTSFEFALHEVGPEVLAGQIAYRMEDARAVLQSWRDFMAGAPDELQGYPTFLNVPPLPAFPEELHGKTALFVVVAYVGEVEEGERFVDPLRSAGSPVLDAVAPLSYVAAQQMFDPGMPKGLRWYSKAHEFDRLTDDAIDTLLGHVDPLPGPHTAVYFGAGGGAISRVAPAATAYPHREAACGLHVFPGWSNPADDDELIGWARTFHDAMTPHASGGVYVNLLGQDEQERVPAAYGSNYNRVAQAKGRYDPGNLFRSNYNIVPDASAHRPEATETGGSPQ